MPPNANRASLLCPDGNAGNFYFHVARQPADFHGFAGRRRGFVKIRTIHLVDNGEVAQVFNENAALRTVLRLMHVVATMVEPVLRVALRYPVGDGLNDGFKGFPGTDLDLAQPGFELAKGQFDGIEIGRIGRQV